MFRLLGGLEIYSRGPEIYRRQLELSTDSRISVITYGCSISEPTMRILQACKSGRILVGKLSTRPGVDSDRVGTNIQLLADFCATRCSAIKVRALEGCHAKLFISHTRGLKAIIGSMNLGGGTEIEMALEATPEQAKRLRESFEELWKESEVIRGFNSSQFNLTRTENAKRS